MNDDQPLEVEGWAIGQAALLAYIDYACRDEIAKMLKSGSVTVNSDVDQLAETMKEKIIKRVAQDVAERTPEVFKDLGQRLREAVA